MGSTSDRVGSTPSDINHAEFLSARAELPEQLFVMASRPAVVCPSRSPACTHVRRAHAHVPQGFQGRAINALLAGDRVIEHIGRFAPGLRDRILRRVDHTPAYLASNNENLVGGSVGGGSLTCL